MSYKLAAIATLLALSIADPIVFDGSDIVFTDVKAPANPDWEVGHAAYTCFDMGSDQISQTSAGYPPVRAAGFEIKFTSDGSDTSFHSFTRVVTTSRNGHYLEETSIDITYVSDTTDLDINKYGLMSFTISDYNDGGNAGYGIS